MARLPPSALVSGARLSELVEHVGAILWEADPVTWQFSYVSPAAEAVLGYSSGRWLEEPDFWARHIHPDDVQWATAACQESTQAGKDHDFEYRMIAADGRTVWMRDIVRVITDAKGVPTRLYGVMVDVTTGKDAEQRLEAQAAELPEVRLLQQVGQAALRSTDLPAVAQDMLELVVRTGRFDMGLVRLLDPETNTLEPVALYGIADRSRLPKYPPGATERQSGGRLARLLTEREPAVAEEIEKDEGFATFKREGARSAVLVPVFAGDQVLGTLAVASLVRRRFEPGEVQLLKAVGNEIGLAVQKFRLYQEAQRLSQQAVSRLEELDVLYGISQMILASPDLPTVAEQVLDAALALVSMDLGSIRVMDSAGKNLVPLASRGYTNPEALYERGVNIDRRPLRSASEAIAANEARVFTDVQTRPGMRSFKREGAQTVVAAPVRAGNETIGIIYMGSREPREVTRRELHLLEAIGSQVGLAIQKARLHEETVEAYADLKRAEEALREGEERYRAVVENMRDGVSIVVGGERIYANPAYLAIHGLSELAEVVGTPAEHFAIPEDKPKVRAASRSLQQGHQQSLLQEVRIRRPDGDIRTLEVSAVHITYRDQPASMALLRDATNRKRLQEQIAHLADHDHLTELLNRRRFEEELERLQVDPTGHVPGGALLYMDLDDFKEINDSLGHQAGDLVLKSLGALLTQQVRDTDVVARMGGDEFTVLMPGVGAGQAAAAAARILTAIEGHRVPYEDQHLRVTASIGIALYPEHGSGWEPLLVAADRAMYRAKERGRNRYELYVPVRDLGPVGRRIVRAYQLRDAMDKNEFFFEAQPILDLKTNQVSQYELLLRLLDAKGNYVPVPEFLGVADRFGLMHDLDRWVVRHAFEVLSDLHGSGGSPVLEVNLSGRALADPGLVPLIRDLLDGSGIEPACLIFEITESEAVPDLLQARKLMESLRELGCRFALDDFGVGFSSFNHLRHLPVDFLKIDGSFIVDLHDVVNRALVKAMVGAAQALGMKTIGESVEDARTLGLLEDLGVDFAQGYYVGGPQPVSELVIRSQHSKKKSSQTRLQRLPPPPAAPPLAPTTAPGTSQTGPGSRTARSHGSS